MKSKHQLIILILSFFFVITLSVNAQESKTKKNSSPKTQRVLQLSTSPNTMTVLKEKNSDSDSIVKIKAMSKIDKKTVKANVFFATQSLAQTLDQGRYYIKNTATGLVLDVKGGHITEGNAVRPHVLNHTRAQVFRIEKINSPDNASPNSYYIKNRGPGPEFFLTAKKQMLTVTDGGLAERPPQGAASDHFTAVAVSEEMSTASGSANNPARTLKNYIVTLENKAPAQTHVLGGLHQQWEIIPMDNESYRIVNPGLGKDMMLLPESIDTSTKLIFRNSATSNLFRWEILPVEPVAPELQNITLADVDIETPPIYKIWRNDKLVITLRWVDSDAVAYSVWLVNSDGSDTELQSNISGTERSYTHKEDRVLAGGIPKRCFRVVKKNEWDNSVSSEIECFQAEIQVPD